MKNLVKRVFETFASTSFFSMCLGAFCCAALAQEPYIADTSLQPLPDARRIALFVGIGAIIFIAAWFFKKGRDGRRNKILLVISIVCFVVAFALPQIPVYREHYFLVVSTHALRRGDLIRSEDVKLVEAKHGQVLDRTINKLEEAIGQVVKHKIAAEQPIPYEPKLRDAIVSTRDFEVGQKATPDDFEEVHNVAFKGRFGIPASSINLLVELHARHPIKAGALVLESDFGLKRTAEREQASREANLREIEIITERIKHGDGPDWYGSRSTYYANLGKFDQALADHDMYMKQTLPPERQREALLKRSDLLFRLKKYSESINALDGLPNTFPSDWEKQRQFVNIKTRTGRVKLALGQTESALRDLNAAYEALDGDPSVELLYYRALANEKLGNVKAAAADKAEMDILGYEPDPKNY